MADKHLNWDHLRVFLALMRGGSLRAAAQELGTSHPTMQRRLAALEAQLGLRLFERGPDRLKPTAEALLLLERAEQVEAMVHGFTRCAANADPRLQGVVRVSAPDMLMSELLAPDLAAFQQQWPEIDLEVETTYDLANLSNRDADIAIRLVPQEGMPTAHLTGRKVAPLAAAVYGEGEVWLGWDDRDMQRMWIQRTAFAELPIRGVLNNIYLQRAACLAGMGLAILPCFMADGLIRRRSEPMIDSDLWVLVHPDMRDNPRLRRFRDHIAAALQQHHDRLVGRFDSPA